MAPVLTAANLPVAGIGILLAVDTIPDMFRTTANVTGWLCVGSILSRGAAADAESAGRAVGRGRLMRNWSTDYDISA